MYFIPERERLGFIEISKLQYGWLRISTNAQRNRVKEECIEWRAYGKELKHAVITLSNIQRGEIFKLEAAPVHTHNLFAITKFIQL